MAAVKAPLEFEARIPIRLKTAEEMHLPALEWGGCFRAHREIIRSVFEESRRGNALMLLALSQDFPVGQIWVDLKRKGPDVGVLWALRTMPGFRGAGIGTRLLDWAERSLAERGFRCAEIGVEDENPRAKALYERRGYRFVSREISRRPFRDPEGDSHVLVTEENLLRKELPWTHAKSESAGPLAL